MPRIPRLGNDSHLVTLATRPGGNCETRRAAKTAAADDAILCLSELVTNAIVHSRSREPDGRFSVRVHLDHGRLRVEVSDQGGPWARPAQTDERNGRGLLIVDQLAHAWGRDGNDQTGWTI